MKGRRRARQSALQALYEIDASGHAIDRVLEERVREFYRAAAAGALERADRPIVEHLLAGPAPRSFGHVPVVDVAASLGMPLPRVQVVVGFLADLEPHAGYCITLVRGVMAHRGELDAVIARIAPEWPVEQMALVDRNVLRIALWEMASGNSPVRVAISEAVELARHFSGEAARRMVNGALGCYAAGPPRLVFAEGADG